MEIVQSASEYYDDLLHEINKAKGRIFLQTMLFESGAKIHNLEKHLIKAVGRGVDVRIHYDWVSEKYLHGDLSKFPVIDAEKRNIMNKIQHNNQKMYDRLEAKGVKLVKTNDPSFLTSAFPYIGRSHIKLSIVDDNFCWVGGINLYDGAFDNFDIMVKSNKKNLISALCNLFNQVNGDRKAEDYKVKIDVKEKLYVDVGNKGKSIIYETAKGRISNAKKSVIFMSQFVPDSKLLREIENVSDKGISVSIFTSPSDNPVFTKYPEKLTYVMLKKTLEDRKNITLTHLSKKVHAKLLIIDDELSLFGSHNFIFSGVLFGTAEIMVENREQKVISGFKKYIQDCLDQK